MTQPIDRLVCINGDSDSPEAQATLRRIAANLEARGVNLENDTLDWPQELELLTRLSALEVQLQVQPSRLPLIGGLVTRVKQAVHQLVLFYVRDLAAQQNAFNAHLVRLISKDDNKNH
jgi:hypothetical protein